MSHTRVYGKPCIYRYDEVRSGDTRKGKGEHTISGRCFLRSVGDRRCFYPDKNHLTCPTSTHKKPKKKAGK
jgi:hypothetical protein